MVFGEQGMVLGNLPTENEEIKFQTHFSKETHNTKLWRIGKKKPNGAPRGGGNSPHSQRKTMKQRTRNPNQAPTKKNKNEKKKNEKNMFRTNLEKISKRGGWVKCSKCLFQKKTS